MKHIIICPGHHSGARGAVNKQHSLTEYDEAVKIAEHLKSLSHARVGEVQFEIYEGRLGAKVRHINSQSPVAAFDLHFNADYDHLDPDDLNDDRGHGVMCMFVPGNSTRKAQADILSAEMAIVTGERDLGGREGWHWNAEAVKSGTPTVKNYFLERTNCPAFIPEFGYIDNNRFTENWLVPARHEELAQSLLNGILKLVDQGQI